MNSCSIYSATYPALEAPQALHFVFGAHEVIEALAERFLRLLGRLGAIGQAFRRGGRGGRGRGLTR